MVPPQHLSTSTADRGEIVAGCLSSRRGARTWLSILAMRCLHLFDGSCLSALIRLASTAPGGAHL